VTDVQRALLALLVAAAALSCGGTPAPAPEAPGEAKPQLEFQLSPAFPPRVFANDSGVTLTMLYLKQEGNSPRQALARFTGLHHPLAGRVVLVTEERSSAGRHTAWRLLYKGSQHGLATEALDARSDARILTTLWLPGNRVKTKLHYDAAASRLLVPEDLFAEHRALVADGTLAALARFDRKAHEARLEESLKGQGRGIDRACKSHVQLEIDWSSITDQDINDGITCASSLSVVEQVCERDEASRRAVTRRIKKAVCAIGSEFALELKGSTLRVTLSKTSRNLDTVTYARLKEELALTNTVVQDKAGQFLVFDPDQSHRQSLYYLGDGVTMHRLLRGSHANLLWTPRDFTIVAKTDKGWSSLCTGYSREFEPVSDEVRLRVLRTAKFKEAKFTRQEFALARDDRGIYYYVDHESEHFGGKNFRVFKGPRTV
jgi:hypothetical protein